MLQWLDISQPPIRVVNPARCNNQYPLGRGQQRMKKSDFSYVFTPDPTGIGRIANRIEGGDSSHQNATFSYTSLRCGINIHKLNCVRVLVLCNTFFRQKKPKLCCELGIQLLMTEQSDVYEKVAF